MNGERDSATEAVVDVDETYDITEMHPGISRTWDLWSTVVGRIAARHLEQVRADFPEMASAIVSTADGLNICAVGLDPDKIDGLAALNSSLFGVARVEKEVMLGVVGADEEGLTAEPETSRVERTSVVISSGDDHTAVLAFVVEPYGMLLLGMSAQRIQPAVVLVEARRAARILVSAIGQEGYSAS